MVRKLKNALKSLLGPLMLSIRSGPLKGKKWIAVTGIRLIKGTYEPFKTTELKENLHEGDVVYDVGAHVGYYTATDSSLVGREGQVIAFGPRPSNISRLKQHLRVNRLSNVRLIGACLGGRWGYWRFETRTGTGTFQNEAISAPRWFVWMNSSAKGNCPSPTF
ncbi:MAG: FkbM family methyltransferase [Phycisphaerales bacterium]|nr:MAG: FkbM family methyltransferase [Phycisphaerales bacterium]